MAEFCCLLLLLFVYYNCSKKEQSLQNFKIMKNLTTIQQQEVARLEEAKAAAIAEIRAENIKAWEYRRDNYFNCVDDYSWGGICDQAARERLQDAEQVYDLYIEQAANGGRLERTYNINILYDLESGEMLTDNIINGQYGLCFILPEGGFQGVVKRQSTYAKKGLLCKTEEITFSFVFSGKFTKKGEIIGSDAEIVSRKEIKYTPECDNASFTYSMFFSPLITSSTN